MGSRTAGQVSVRWIRPAPGRMHAGDVNGRRRFRSPRPENEGFSRDDVISALWDDSDAPAQKSKSQNDYLQDWIERRDVYMACSMANHALPANGANCEECGECGAIWRCDQCPMRQILCANCIRRQHLFDPLHMIRYWNGAYFQMGALWQVGATLALGHRWKQCKGKAGQRQREDVLRADLGRDVGSTQWESVESELNEQGDEWVDADDVEDVEVDGDLEPEDEDEGLRPTGSQRKCDGLPFPTASEADGRRFVRVVDINGLHFLPLSLCQCEEVEKDEDILFVEQRLWPMSFKRVKTAFTFEVLEDFLLHQQECNTTGYQYARKIQRATSHMWYTQVPHLHRELRRAARGYRNLQLRWWSGFTDGQVDPKEGALAVFCASCPQPGINLPDNWREDVNKDVFIRSYVTDGNFKADHVKQKRPEDDVFLAEGQLYLTSPSLFKPFLPLAEEYGRKYKQKATCHRYNATSQANAGDASLDVTGVVAHACARHGCFAPSSVVDLQKGERQANVDYSLCQAIKHSNLGDITSVLLIYDIMCQYHINLRHRVTETQLDLPTSLDILPGIGLFHVHGHKEDCLFRYGTTYIPGAGRLAGKILEPIWSQLNSVFISTRTSTLAHRMEVLDDRMRDSNVKKMLGAAPTRRALELELASNELTVGLPQATSWLTRGFELITMQEHLKQELRRMGPEPSRTQQAEILTQRHRLVDKFRQFDELATQHFSMDLQDAAATVSRLDIENRREVENRRVIFPSELPQCADHPIANILLQKELTLREGLLNDCLHDVRMHLSKLAWQFKFNVRKAKAGKRVTRAYNGVNKISRDVTLVRLVYTRSRKVLVRFRGESPLYQPLLESECQTSTTIVDPNTPGQSRDRLAWFWLTANQPYGIPDGPDATDEVTHISEYYRLNWLRGRAQLHRWKEEVLLTRYEMEWTVRFFMYTANLWASQRDQQLPSAPSHIAYAEEQLAIFNQLGKIAEHRFSVVNSHYVPIWQPVGHKSPTHSVTPVI
ncbi:hypothetical protein CPB83DRAFT_891565 [Crepidotus variabilis]|uniref:CxC2-like cysteine cluster KDZ transposase-associated domain-containing protein n=1 Tax=Crepidotus variabilis TaxID=179855 RepID=A0A9P6EM59_9AGAR|nr:hypothetical protein CPB83DRAFT_891565 [Crepidotus variabilis]